MRHIRNITVGAFILFATIGFCLYLSSVLYILLVWGPHYLNFQAINPNFSDFPHRLWPSIFDYIYDWWTNRSNYNPTVQLKLLISVLGPFATLVIIFWSARNAILNWKPFKKKEALHGDAKWATEKEIRKIGLRSKHGLLLGKDKKGFLIAGGFQHALLFAPTGSGKGVGFVIPNLLFWQDSVIVHDIKLENYELTSGYRKKIGQEVYCWSPADADGLSHCYNPLDWVSAKPGQMVDDVQKIANLLMPEQDFWVNEARSLFLGVVLYILAVPEKIKSFGEVVRTMRSDDVVYNLAVVLDTIGKDIHPVAYMNIAAFLQKAEKERSGVISTMNSSLELWANPLIDTTTASSDFNFMEFKKKRVTVYVGLTPDNLTRLQPLMQVFYQQATEFLCRKLPDKKTDPYGVLFMMDEFPTLGEMEQFKTGIAYFRGYNVRLFLIIQDTEQLKGIYEEAGMNSFLSNSTYRITFAANNIETANLISQLIGNKTVAQESLNKPKFLDLNPASRSLHVSETQRALLLPQEVIMLPRDEQILLIESTSPIKSKKIFYYKDAFFTKRLHSPTFIPTQEPFDPKKYEEKIKEEKKIEKQEEENPPIENLESLPKADSEEEEISEGSNLDQENNSAEKSPDNNKEYDEHDDDDEFDEKFEEDNDEFDEKFEEDDEETNESEDENQSLINDETNDEGKPDNQTKEEKRE
ncbi:MAG: type IV secretory system conjugative DNA transfer family protein [Rickettsiaceae bacterium H1]|nr:type IV secretory system conjugative DNA transfer family protein [Rickettsiaceae bacterium H1]